jgi:DNA-binding CsgD family transcriptional regulator
MVNRTVAPSFDFAELSDEAARKRQLIGIMKRRQQSPFAICDASMRVLFASHDNVDHILSGDGADLLVDWCRESRLSKGTVVRAYDDETVVRIVPLGPNMFGCVAIFVEVFSHRGSIFEATKTFGLTRRESEVLQLLLAGKTTTQIADALSVAESTAADHTGSIMRKAGVSRRAELICKIFNPEIDLGLKPLALSVPV